MWVVVLSPVAGDRSCASRAGDAAFADSLILTGSGCLLGSRAAVAPLCGVGLRIGRRSAGSSRWTAVRRARCMQGPLKKPAVVVLRR